VELFRILVWVGLGFALGYPVGAIRQLQRQTTEIQQDLWRMCRGQ